MYNLFRSPQFFLWGRAVEYDTYWNSRKDLWFDPEKISYEDQPEKYERAEIEGDDFG